MKNIGRSWAVGISLLLHGFVLVGLGAGTLPGSVPQPDTMAVYLAMPSMEVQQSSNLDAFPFKKAVAKPAISQPAKEVRPEAVKADPPPAAEVDSLSNSEELIVVTKPQAFIETSNSYNPGGIINGAKDRVDTDYRLPITDHQPPLLAFAGDPAA
ncbi:hypothetical protein MUP29_02485, partial [bacterium]|nr:hypothetical protein [bacterium]